MPVTYSIDATRRLIHTVCTGHLNFAEVMDHFRQLKVDPACCGRMDVLLDVSNADSLPESNQIGAVGTALGAIRPKVQFEAWHCGRQRCHVRDDANVRGPGWRLFWCSAGVSEGC